MIPTSREVLEWYAKAPSAFRDLESFLRSTGGEASLSEVTSAKLVCPTIIEITHITGQDVEIRPSMKSQRSGAVDIFNGQDYVCPYDAPRVFGITFPDLVDVMLVHEFSPIS